VRERYHEFFCMLRGTLTAYSNKKLIWNSEFHRILLISIIELEKICNIQGPQGYFFNPNKKDESILCHSHFILCRRCSRPQTQCRLIITQSISQMTQMLIKYNIAYEFKDTEVKLYQCSVKIKRQRCMWKNIKGKIEEK
jgi:hypothetical protein